MRLVLFDCWTPNRRNFYPLALSRPVFELRCGMTTLGEKLIARCGAREVACFVPPYLADAYRDKTPWPVNDASMLRGGDLLLVNGRVKADGLVVDATGPGEIAVAADGEVLWARISRDDLETLDTGSLDALLASAAARLPRAPELPKTWNYTWELVLANAAQLTVDFAAAGRHGIEGVIEEPNAIRGSHRDVYIASGAVVHPMVVIDAKHGPVYLDEGVVVHPFTRIEGPCYVGKHSILLGAKCREGNSIGPMCRIGGEIEESIIQGHSNKYHDGFLGHAYLGEWVNLGALTTNSDLKNDYSHVSVVLDGKTPIDTGSTKVGSLIGDHTKTAIGTLLNTGAYVGAMTVLAPNGRLMPKFLPSFCWCVDGTVAGNTDKQRAYKTAKIAMSRRKCAWSPTDEALWDAVYELTAPDREAAIQRNRQK